jgi:hypothetical protein
MAEQLNEDSFTGAHPTAAEFLDQMLAWGFTRQPDRGVHAVLRGPHGGRIQILRSLAGRADATQVEKAARLTRISVEAFWAGPEALELRRSETAPGDSGGIITPEGESIDVAAATPAPHKDRRKTVPHDRVTSLVLAAHTKADRPLGFDEVVDLCGGRATRQQIVAASAALCRDGDLDRIRSGVYQWSAGERAARHDHGSAGDLRILRQQSWPASTHTEGESRHKSTAQVLRQLFPAGLRLTPDMYDDLERWAALTEKLTNRAEAG